ncbi:MAG: DUF1674 domain-containing protein [Alphaproteobacteria bacterium]|nr:DUF1674 domain-containing protein [Alphaproteobacteria bacterium]
MDKKKPSPESLKEAKKQKMDKPLQEKEIGGFENRAEPTRFGDWEVNGRCSDF